GVDAELAEEAHDVDGAALVLGAVVPADLDEPEAAMEDVVDEVGYGLESVHLELEEPVVELLRGALGLHSGEVLALELDDGIGIGDEAKEERLRLADHLVDVGDAEVRGSGPGEVFAGRAEAEAELGEDLLAGEPVGALGVGRETVLDDLGDDLRLFFAGAAELTRVEVVC